MTNSLYIKYRPNNFDEVVGQKVVKQILINSISQNKINHGYLFYGIRGVGKTTLARIFAKSINCTNLKKNHNPCNECESCKSINSFSSFDVIEIDAASNNGVDEIREIKDKANYSTTNSKYKVYIIDEIHMLSKSAFNALLKTLEEPPSNTIFLLATTEINKIPETVLSRLIILNLETLTENEIIEKLTLISKLESVKLEDDSLKYVSKVSNGSLRDAISYLETIFLYSKNLNEKKITKILGILPDYKLNQYLLDSKLMINFIKDSEVDFKNFLLVTINYLTDQILKGDLFYQNLLNNLISLSINVKDPYLLKLSLINIFINKDIKLEANTKNNLIKDNDELKQDENNQIENFELMPKNSEEKETNNYKKIISQTLNEFSPKDKLLENENNSESNVSKKESDLKTEEIELKFFDGEKTEYESDFKKSNLDLSDIDSNKNVTDFINLKNYLTVFFDYSSKKSKKFNERFNYLSSYLNKKSLREYVSLLLEGKILISSNESIAIFGLQTKEQYDKFKEISLEANFLNFLKELFGEEVILLPVLSEDWKKLNKTYKDLKDEGKIVKEKIKIADIKNEEIINKYKQIFGDKLEIVNE